MKKTSYVKSQKQSHAQAGFTLVEVMVAMFCFLIVALALGAMTTRSWGTVTHSRLGTEASVLGSRNIEAIVSRAYHDAAISNGSHSPAPEGIYTVSYDIGDDALLPDSKYVQMNVNYNIGGKVKNVRYHYLLPERVQ
jgi:prepilin-type N-terminal cleavage/methylation domain-containing protein